MIPAGYYAIPDPDHPTEHMTYWHLRAPQPNGDAMNWTAWPPRARYGPKLLKRDIPKDHDERMAAIRAYDVVLTAWNRTLRATLTDSTAAACAARFAELRTRCFICARALTDARSKLLGIGPECRRMNGFDEAELLEHVTPSIAAAHAVQLAAGASR